MGARTLITVLSWFWHQDNGRARYEPKHVNTWAAMVSRHLSMPHRVACVTDTPEGLDKSIEIIAPPRDFEDWRIPSWGADKPQCLRRLAMFAPDAGRVFGERFVCMDLDCVIAGPLDPLFETAADFKIFRGTARTRAYNGSMMLLTAGARPQVYETLTRSAAIEAGRKFVGSDQAWITYCLGPNEQTWGPEDGVVWWGRHQAMTGNPRLVFFPGAYKPWQLLELDFVRRHYRGAMGGRCLVLGLGTSVWRDAERALKRGPVSAVVATRPAAEQWPGEVLAVANSDSEAEIIAASYGFDEIVVCGRQELGAA